MQISAAIIEKSSLFNIVENIHDSVTKMVSIPMFSRSKISINTLRNYRHIYLFRIWKLAAAIITNPSFFNFSDSMHDNEIKVVSITTFSRSRIMIKTT